MDSTNSIFTIGVTGHRDLVSDEIDTIRANIKQRLEYIKSLLPNTKVVVITGMAEGADTLVAETALECNLHVEALLPMPLESYRDDFGPEALAKLESMLAHDNVSTTISKYSLSQEPELLTVNKFRNRCYASMGDEIVDRSVLLLSLWDGINVCKEGGTSDIVLRFLNLGKFDDHLDDIQFTTEDEVPANDKLIMWQPVNRRSHVEPVVTDLSPKILLASYDAHRFICTDVCPLDFIGQLNQLDEYNAHYDAMSDADKNVYDNRLTATIDWQHPHAVDEIATMDAAFVKADNTAMYHQQHSNQQFKLFAYMAGLMGVLFLVYAKIYSAKIFIILYAALFLAGLYMFSRTKKAHAFSSHLSSRLVAETLRVKVYLTLAGIEQRLPIEKYLGLSGVNRFSGFNWLKFIFKPLSFKNEHYPEGQEQQALDYVREHWIRDQANYFRKKGHALHEQHEQIEKVKQFILTGSFIAALSLIFFKTYLISVVLAGEVDLKTIVVFMMGLLPFLLGVWEIYQGKMAIKELQWQYSNQRGLFETTLTKLEHAITIQDQKDIIFKLAENCLMESYLWTIHRYHREHEPPSAG